MLNKYWVLLFFLKFLIKLIHQVASILNSKKRVFSKPGEKPVVVQAAVINTIDWMAEITFISHSSEAGKSKVRVSAWLWGGFSSPCTLTLAEGARTLSPTPCIRALISLIRAPPS